MSKIFKVSGGVKFGFILCAGNDKFNPEILKPIPELVVWQHYNIIDKKNMRLIERHISNSLTSPSLASGQIKTIAYNLMGGIDKVEELFYGIEPEISIKSPNTLDIVSNKNEVLKYKIKVGLFLYTGEWVQSEPTEQNSIIKDWQQRHSILLETLKLAQYSLPVNTMIVEKVTKIITDEQLGITVTE